MGVIFSKIMSQASEPKTVQSEGVIFEDPRSPTEGVQRTPLAHDKRAYLETDIDNVTPTLPLRVKLLKRVTDPRSPTVGINRTPLSLLPSEEFDSPVSLYSDYQADLDSFSCMQSPTEPSVNVSDFESDRFAKELDSLVDQFNTSLSDRETFEPKPCVPLTLGPAKPQSTTLSPETKRICEGLIQEIIESFKECEQEMSKSAKKTKLTLASAPTTPQTHSLKIKKTRKPLTNITSAGNTPIKHKNKKDTKLVRVEKTGENSPSPLTTHVKQRIQWDQDATVII